MQFPVKKVIILIKFRHQQRPAGLILHSDTEQICFMDIICICTYTYIRTHINTNRHSQIHTYEPFLST